MNWNFGDDFSACSNCGMFDLYIVVSPSHQNLRSTEATHAFATTSIANVNKVPIQALNTQKPNHPHDPHDPLANEIRALGMLHR